MSPTTILRPAGQLRIARRVLAATLALAALIIVGLGYAAGHAHAAVGRGCETIRWGFLGSQLRTICDTPRYPDGHWDRQRIIWTPSHFVPTTCYSGTWYANCSGGYRVGDTLQAKEAYPVNDGNVLPDEPGWLPTGTDTIR